MKKQIIFTILLLIAIAFTTAIYFNSLNSQGMRTDRIMHSIPNNAALIFEFNNDKSFYDIYKENKLFAAITGKQQLDELITLKQELFQNLLLKKFFDSNNLYISLHPSAENTVDLLFTMSATKGLDGSVFDQLSKQPNSGLIVNTAAIGKIQGYALYINTLKKRFYIIKNNDHILSGSFSMDLVRQSTLNNNDKSSYVLMPDRQNANSLASLYINYTQTSLLLEQFLKNKNSDIFDAYKQFKALAALNLNYRSDALMFNGTTLLSPNSSGYLNLFARQQPVVNHLKDIFPSTTAYCTTYAISDPQNFEASLSKYHVDNHVKKDNEELYKRIKNETGIKISTAFTALLGNEFALITTRYFEKFAIISVKDGSKLKELLSGLSTVADDTKMRLNYEKLPYYLLGEPFDIFKKPYFMVIDNYLILANSISELSSYYEVYINRKFLSKNERYNEFDNLLAGRSNFAFMIIFKNTREIFERDLKQNIVTDLEDDDTGWDNFYALSWQFSSSENSYYTNFCLRLNTDTTANNLK